MVHASGRVYISKPCSNFTETISTAGNKMPFFFCSHSIRVNLIIWASTVHESTRDIVCSYRTQQGAIIILPVRLSWVRSNISTVHRLSRCVATSSVWVTTHVSRQTMLYPFCQRTALHVVLLKSSPRFQFWLLANDQLGILSCSPSARRSDIQVDKSRYTDVMGVRLYRSRYHWEAYIRFPNGIVLVTCAWIPMAAVKATDVATANHLDVRHRKAVSMKTMTRCQITYLSLSMPLVSIVSVAANYCSVKRSDATARIIIWRIQVFLSSQTESAVQILN
jgi:hypothetical protein